MKNYNKDYIMHLVSDKNRLTLALQSVTESYRLRKLALLAVGSLLTTSAMGAAAQAAEESVMALEEVVVTARRKDESLQDVPLTVNVVTTEMLDNLNIRNFSDLQNVVAGLTLQEDSLAPTASVRG